MLPGAPQIIARDAAQIDNLLPRAIELIGDGVVIEWKALPKFRKMLRRHGETRGKGANRRDSEQFEIAQDI